MIGDPHIRTFDGQFIPYQGGCKYNMATPGSETFRVSHLQLRKDGADTVATPRTQTFRVSYLHLTKEGINTIWLLPDLRHSG